MAKNKQQSRGDDTWWSQVEEAPRAGLPDAEKMRRKARWMKYGIVAAIVFGALGSFAGFLSVTSPEAEVEAPDTYTAPGRALATDTVNQWIAGDTSPLPGASILSWDGADQVASNVAVDESATDSVRYDMYLHKFTAIVHPVVENVVSESGSQFAVSVLISHSATLGDWVMSAPSAVPTAPSDPSFEPAGMWPGMPDAEVSEAVVTSVQAWAAAFTGDNPDNLRLVVGDTNPSNYYTPLQGVTGFTVEPVAAAALDFDEETSTYTRIVVSVNLRVTYEPISTEPSVGDSKSRAEDKKPIQFDLLMTGADTAAPRVVAWGAPGTGPTLSDFQNATVPARVGSVPGSSAVDPGQTQSATPNAVTPSATPTPGETETQPDSGDGGSIFGEDTPAPQDTSTTPAPGDN